MSKPRELIFETLAQTLYEARELAKNGEAARTKTMLDVADRALKALELMILEPPQLVGMSQKGGES